MMRFDAIATGLSPGENPGLLTEPPLLLVTGASGYIGRALVRLAVGAGWCVRALARSPGGLPRIPGVTWHPYDLAHDPDPGLFSGVRAVVHLAAMTQGRVDRETEAREVAAGRRLFELAGESGARLLFVSSQSAVTGAESAYARVKRTLEGEALSRRGIVVRPGLVYGGGHPGGQFGFLCRLVATLPILPRFVPAPPLQPIHVEDLCRALLSLAAGGGETSTSYNLGDREGVTWQRFLRLLAWERFRRCPLWLPVPLLPLSWAARLMDRFSGGEGGIGQRVQGLVALKEMETATSLVALELTLRPLRSGLRRGGGNSGPWRRDLAGEGYLLLRYVAGSRPPVGMVCRYVRVQERAGVREGLPLAPVVHALPRLLWILERPGAARDLERSLAIAVAIAEASPRFADRFLQLRPLSPILALFEAFVAGVREVLARMCRPWVGLMGLRGAVRGEGDG
ncbi:MAG: NAD-dependent epimerase/dehydratase family protein [Magnetococcales bacterium]|nr:NAD-dependent epimerase/dehydratase family protein [Magnetococcales bacterium]MBF0157216.1 NAD-dependent epimerase/dehydratase family protein [Magnetococcales bacterium]